MSSTDKSKKKSGNDHLYPPHAIKKRKNNNGNNRNQKSSKSRSPYHEAADIWNRLHPVRNNNTMSLKRLVYHPKTNELLVSTKTYAIVSEILQHTHILQRLVDQFPSVTNNVKNAGLLFVLIHELLFSPKQSIQGGGALKRLLLKHESQLRHALADLQQEMEENASHPTAVQQHPRYIRVNTCLTTDVQQVVCELEDYLQIPVYADQHIPDLLVVPQSATKQIITDNGCLGSSNVVVLQDKSSCFSSLCLIHGFDDNDNDDAGDGDILDACAAPGNKTSHLAALLLLQYDDNDNNQKTMTTDNKRTTIFALDRDKERCQQMKDRLSKLVPTNNNNNNITINVQNQDFLQTKPDDYPTVTSILLDPSCSGSGIMSQHRLMVGGCSADVSNSNNNESKKDYEGRRLESLAKFQIQALRHAMSFPHVNRIVYSTCSIHVEENEHVVYTNLLQDDENNNDWELVSPRCLQNWKRRGLENIIGNDGNNMNDQQNSKSKMMIRVDPQYDETNGFFVACLQRRRQRSLLSSSSSSRGEKRKSSSTPWRNSNLDLNGISIYNGEFRTTTTKKAKTTGDKASANTQNSILQESITPAVQDDKPNQKQILTGKNKVGPHAKKRAKKLDWKRRQREQKLARIKAKKSAAAKAPKA